MSQNKKGQVQFFLENAFRIGFLMLALLVFFLLINFYINNRIDTNRLQAEVTASRIMYSDTIMYEENYRTYLGIVDIKKFNDANIIEKINYPIKRHATAKMDIISNENGSVVHTAYLNRAQYENLEVLVKSPGKGGATDYQKNYPITYLEGGEYHYGTLMMTLIIPNS
ncbi:MAG: hypothetical protein ACP5NW_02580 [Candidatus Woesearchaeota archaeon]